MSELRYLGDRRVGGCLVAFTGPEGRDAYGNYWTAESDFALQRYERRPVYFQHRGGMVEAGYIEAGALGLRDDGLYGEAELLANEAGDGCLALVQRGAGHWSTGVMPGSYRERADGFMELWPFVEASITDRPATKRGLTRVAMVRDALGLTDDGDDGYLRRGPTVADEDKDKGQGEAAGAGGNGGGELGRDDIAAIVRQVMSETAPGRVLKPAPLPPGLGGEGGAEPPIQVGHVYDQMSLLGLCLRAHYAQQAGVSDAKARTEMIRALRVKVDRQLVKDGQIEDGELLRGATRMIDAQVVQDWGKHLRANEAMGSTYSTFGDELVPTLLNSVVWYHVMLQSRVASLLRRVQMPSNPWDYPIVTGGPTIRKVGEITDQTAFGVHASPIPSSKIGTNKVTFNAGAIGALVLGSLELFEDSGVDVMEVWANQIVRKMAQGIDHVLLNGDEAATTANISHLGVDPTGTVYDSVLVMDGLRKKAFANSDTAAVATFVTDSPITLRRLMGGRGRFALYPSELALIVDPEVYYRILALDVFEPVSSMGEKASLLTGQVGAIKGVPIIVSEEIEGTDAAGKYPSTHDGTLGSFLVVNHQNILVGYRRDVQFDLFRVPGVNGFAAPITARLDLQEMEAGQAALGYNNSA